jgi:hypothetical protein
MYWRALGSTGFDSCAPNKLFNRYSEANRSYALTVSHVLIYKVKQSHNTPMEAQGEEKVQLLLIHDLGTRCGWVVSVAPRPHFTPRERTPWYPLDRRLGGPRAGLDKEFRGKTILPLPRSLGRPVRSQTLYWLSYSSSRTYTYCSQLTPSEISVSLYLSEIT